MKNLIAVLIPLLAASCGKAPDSAPPPAPPPPSAPAAAAPEGPASLTVKHVLIAVKGGPLETAKLEKPEAEKLAFEILARARSGEDFDGLVQQYSDDLSRQPYSMTNTGTPPGPGEVSRSTMYRGFGDVSFRLQVGQVGIAEYDPQTSAYGYHVIKRVK
jgi:parvulin-like peptidyl-prolyl isomerase